MRLERDMMSRPEDTPCASAASLCDPMQSLRVSSPERLLRYAYDLCSMRRKDRNRSMCHARCGDRNPRSVSAGEREDRSSGGGSGPCKGRIGNGGCISASLRCEATADYVRWHSNDGSCCV